MCFHISVFYVFYIFIICVIQRYVNCLVLPTNHTVSVRYERHANCTHANEFQCNSGECINEDLVCNGKGDCADNSDETVQLCSRSWCLKTTYRCQYGACVHFLGRCNGIKDCIDGSDEMFCPDELLPGLIPTPSPFDNGCIVPKHPENGVYTNGHTTYKPDRLIMEYDPLFVECNKGFSSTLPEQKLSVCFNGSWVPPPNRCSRLCQALQSTVITDITCILRGKRLDSCDEPIEETQAVVTCAEGYEESSLVEPFSIVCKNGSWDYHFEECIPLCGLKPSENSTKVGNDDPIEQRRSYPWHVGIYNLSDARYLCSGTIIGERIILTAASCLTDISKEKINFKEVYFVAVGKYYRSTNDSRDRAARYYAVESIHIPNQQQGEINNYEVDLAVVVLARKLKLSRGVQPVCINWEDDVQIHNLSQNVSGIEIGWDDTNELTQQNISIQPYEECKKNAPEDFKNYPTFDKLCVKSSKNDSCSEIVGGGLIFQHTNGRYYLEGIASSRYLASEKICQFQTYTLINNYMDFIKNVSSLI